MLLLKFKDTVASFWYAALPCHETITFKYNVASTKHRT